MNKEKSINQNNSVGIIKTQNFTFEILNLESGEKFGPVTLAYETYGSLNKEKTNPQTKPMKNTINLDQRVYLKKDLNKLDRDVLLRKGFKEIKYQGINGEKQDYLVQYYKNESFQHIIWVYEIAKYLKKFTKNIETPRTIKADIIFEANNKKYAIEVETGKLLAKDKSKIIEKVKYLDSDFDKNWFFFVTNLNLKKNYQKFGETFDRRGIKNKISKLFKK